MLKRVLSASAICLGAAVSTFSVAPAAVAAAPASPALYCAPTLQDVQCIVNEVLHPCQTRCAATTADTASVAQPASLPGDPCSRDWGQPVETVCHL